MGAWWRRAWCVFLLAGSLRALGTEPVPIDLPDVHNAFRVNDRFISGSQPESEAAFAALAKLGVKTIVSVDGNKPDVASARKYGLRYVHLPFGYDGIPTERVAQLARAATSSEGGIFVHCHHGKHRGPAAVAVMCEATAGWTAARAESWLKQAGTAADYPGLYRAAREFQPIAPAELARVMALPEVAETPDVVDAMVRIDELFEELKRTERRPEAATLLWEELREFARHEDTLKRSADYRAKLSDSEKAADAVRAALRTGSPEDALKALGQTCAACHKKYRNQSE